LKLAIDPTTVRIIDRKTVRKAMRGNQTAMLLLATSAFALFLWTGCYAKSAPMPLSEPSAKQSPEAGSRPTLLVGIRGASHGDNIQRLHPERLTQRLAERLADAGIFSEVVYPLTELSPAIPDIVFEISISSHYDLHPLTNLAKDVAVGLSVLLLQPVLPTVYDLNVEVSASASPVGDQSRSKLVAARQSRFEFTWLRASEESIEAWHHETTERAIDALVKRIVDFYGPDPQAEALDARHLVAR
jgi:hypothetical protein